MKRSFLTFVTLVAIASSASAGGQTGTRQRPAKKKVRGAVDHAAADGAVLRRTVVLSAEGGPKVSTRPDLTWRNFDAAGKGFTIEDGGPAEMDVDRAGVLSLQGALEVQSARKVGKVTLLKLRHPTRGHEQAAEIRVLHRGRRIITKRKKADAASSPTPDDAQAAVTERPAVAAARDGSVFSHTVASAFGPIELSVERTDPRLIRLRSTTGPDLWISTDALRTAAARVGQQVVQNAMTGGTDGLTLGYHVPSLALVYSHGGHEGHIDNQAFAGFLDAYNAWATGK
ncbi:MAG TPA: hypothetical protein VMZ28_21815 [Kofleriaceae bacterium]|nr:hypothetical protein [Kofleriaceae bacterium]